jgi:hypothetical protein
VKKEIQPANRSLPLIDIFLLAVNKPEGKLDQLRNKEQCSTANEEHQI